MTQHELKCTPNYQCKCIVSMKTRYATMWNAQFFFKWWMQIFLYEVLTSTPKQVYLVQVQCKVKNAMHDDKQMFLDFLKIKEIQKAKGWFYDP